jgi:hypothetical protein
MLLLLRHLEMSIPLTFLGIYVYRLPTPCSCRRAAESVSALLVSALLFVLLSCETPTCEIVKVLTAVQTLGIRIPSRRRPRPRKKAPWW